jgi:hypothetical protein
MLKKLAVAAVFALAGLLMAADPLIAQPGDWDGPPRPWVRRPPPPPTWGGPGWDGPGFGIYIGPQVTRRPPPPVRMYCNYRACAATYRSFDPRTCTYQSLYGPRRYCNIR